MASVSSGVDFRIGTASWTDPTLVKSDLFYPPSVKTAEDRLRFYAERFNTVEVDSTYYALPAERNAELWVDRTPPDFLFNIKAFALMTQHPAEVSRLPKNLREMLPAAQREARRLERPAPEMLDCLPDVLERTWPIARNRQARLGDLPIPTVLRR